MSALTDQQFKEHVEGGKLAVDSHYLLLRIANIYLTNGSVFTAVDNLHSRGWSFGQGILRFNRTLDIFYVAQLATALIRLTNYFDEEVEDIYSDDFNALYTESHGILHEEVWKDFYTTSFLAQPLTARFWRLPNLLDRTDTNNQIYILREGTGQFTKLPRWAFLVTQTHWRQPTLSKATMKELAISTLQETTSRQRKDCPGDKPQPYSETQTHFWLNNMGIERISSGKVSKSAWDIRWLFGSRVAQGFYDVRKWEAHYSQERWESIEAQTQVLEPDLDGTKKSLIEYRGFVEDAGTLGIAWEFGWEEELGSEEEIMFLAAVAAKEVETLVKDNGADAVDGAILTGLNYAIRSHMILGVLRAAFGTDQTDRTKYIEDLKRQILSAGRLQDKAVRPFPEVDSWVKLVLEIVEPYAANRTQPVDALDWSGSSG